MIKKSQQMKGRGKDQIRLAETWVFLNPIKVDQSQNQYDLKLKSQSSLTLQSTLIYRVFIKCLIFIDKD